MNLPSPPPPPDAPPHLEVKGAVARITLQRPSVANRLEIDDLQRLQTLLRAVNEDANVRVLVLQAQGRHFCSGFNIDAVPGVDAGALFEQLSNAWEAARPITIAAIQGGIYGGATDLALACDFRLGVSRSEMFVPAARLGLHFYEGGMARYVSRLGLGLAKRVLLKCETLDAQAMLACGFLDEMLADGPQLQEACAHLERQLCALAPLAIQGMKKHLNAIAGGTLDRAALRQDIVQANRSTDLAEGVRAWQEKRPPVFQGR